MQQETEERERAQDGLNDGNRERERETERMNAGEARRELGPGLILASARLRVREIERERISTEVGSIRGSAGNTYR